jgi:tRNA pseudouridine13 synthase
LAGDCLQLAGSNSFFLAEAPDAALIARVQAGELHPSGPLWGRGTPASRGEAAEIETAALVGFDPWLQGLAAAGMDQERRPLRLMPADWSWAWVDDTDLELAFRLPAGAFATAVLRELVDWDPASGEE